MQFNFPLLPSVSATFRYEKMTLVTPKDCVFEIPSEYEMQEEDVLSPRRQQEMLNKMATSVQSEGTDIGDVEETQVDLVVDIDE